MTDKKGYMVLGKYELKRLLREMKGTARNATISCRVEIYDGYDSLDGCKQVGNIRPNGGWVKTDSY